MAQLSKLTGVETKYFKIIKILKPEYFRAKNNVITQGEDIYNYYLNNKEEVHRVDSESFENLKKIKLSQEIAKGDLEKSKLKGEIILLADEKQFLIKLATIISSTLKAKLVDELPTKIGYLPASEHKEFCKNYYNEIIDLLKKEMDKHGKSI